MARVDLDERKIDFELAEGSPSTVSAREPRGARQDSVKAPRKRSTGASGGGRGGRAGRVQALPEVAPELLEQADILLGNSDVPKSRALKRKLLDESAAQGKGSGKAKADAKGGGKSKPAGKGGKPRSRNKAAAPQGGESAVRTRKVKQ